MLRIGLKLVLAAITLSVVACGGSDSPGQPAQTAAQLNKGTYYAGMLLFAKEVSQLANGAVVGYRLTEGDGSGKMVERVGVMTVNHIDSSRVSFAWYTYDTDNKSIRSSGVTTLTPNGDGADLDNDGVPDVQYITSPATRAGLTGERFLKFAFHVRLPAAKRGSFRIIDNGQTEAVLAGRNILQFAHDGSMLAVDRNLPVVNPYANGQIKYAKHPVVNLLRANDRLLDTTLETRSPQARSENKMRSWDSFIHSVERVGKVVVHTVVSTAETAESTVVNYGEIIASDVVNETEAIVATLRSIWGRIQSINYSGLPLQGAYLGLNYVSDGGEVTMGGGARAELDLTIDISIDLASFAKALVTGGHPSFGTFQIVSRLKAAAEPTVTFKNLSKPFSHEALVTLAPAIWIPDTPFSISPAKFALDLSCTPGKKPLNGSFVFSLNSGGATEVRFNQGGFSADLNGPGLSVSLQNVFTAGTDASCTFGMGPAFELAAADFVKLPVAALHQMRFDANGIRSSEKIIASMKAGLGPITLWDIGSYPVFDRTIGPVIPY